MTAKHVAPGHISHSPQPAPLFSFISTFVIIRLGALHNLALAKPSKSDPFPGQATVRAATIAVDSRLGAMLPWYGEATSPWPITSHISRETRCASAAICWFNIGAPALSFQQRAELSTRLSTRSSWSSSSQPLRRSRRCSCCHMSEPVVFHSGKRCAGRPVAVPILQFHAMGIHVCNGHEVTRPTSMVCACPPSAFPAVVVCNILQRKRLPAECAHAQQRG
jgi:hypothetical protein